MATTSVSLLRVGAHSGLVPVRIHTNRTRFTALPCKAPRQALGQGGGAILKHGPFPIHPTSAIRSQSIHISRRSATCAWRSKCRVFFSARETQACVASGESPVGSRSSDVIYPHATRGLQKAPFRLETSPRPKAGVRCRHVLMPSIAQGARHNRTAVSLGKATPPHNRTMA